MNLPKMDSTTIHGIAVGGAMVMGAGTDALNVVAHGGSFQVALIGLVYALLHIFLPQAPAS